MCSIYPMEIYFPFRMKRFIDPNIVIYIFVIQMRVIAQSSESRSFSFVHKKDNVKVNLRVLIIIIILIVVVHILVYIIYLKIITHVPICFQITSCVYKHIYTNKKNNDFFGSYICTYVIHTRGLLCSTCSHEKKGPRAEPAQILLQ